MHLYSYLLPGKLLLTIHLSWQSSYISLSLHISTYVLYTTLGMDFLLFHTCEALLLFDYSHRHDLAIRRIYMISI
jgi:hypothetical protein